MGGGGGGVFAYIIENMLIQYKTSFCKRYHILKFICRLVSFIFILGNGKLLNSVSDTLVSIVFKGLL